jgi:signal peptidase I
MKKVLHFLRSRRNDLIFYAVFLFILICVRSSVFASYHVPTGSMNPTILEGDFFFTNKLAYRLKVPLTKTSVVEWSLPSRGELVIFKFPDNERELYTKRVIGLPGDVVQLRGGNLYVNGEKKTGGMTGKKGGKTFFRETLGDEEYTIQHINGMSYMTDTPPVKVPEGHIFVMGDNRDNSYDSRAWGCLPLDNVEGRMFIRWFSFDRSRMRPRLERIGLI